MDKNHQLQEIAEQVRKCRNCRLCETALNAVPGDGNINSEVIFIGEAPGAEEDKLGLPFVGRAGKLLEKGLNKLGYKREGVWIGNIIKHRPPQNRDPLPDEIEACRGYLTRQISLINPKVIVTLGRFSMNYFIPEAKISLTHGRPQPVNGRLIYPVYHPAAALRNSSMMKEFVKDILNIPYVLKNADLLIQGKQPTNVTNSLGVAADDSQPTLFD